MRTRCKDEMMDFFLVSIFKVGINESIPVVGVLLLKDKRQYFMKNKWIVLLKSDCKNFPFTES